MTTARAVPLAFDPVPPPAVTVEDVVGFISATGGGDADGQRCSYMHHCFPLPPSSPSSLRGSEPVKTVVRRLKK